MRRFRSAISGRFVKRATARRHPRTTVGETVERTEPDEGTVARLVDYFHEIEYVDAEVGWVCGCDEDGDLWLPTLEDARKHVIRSLLVALPYVSGGAS